MILWTGRVLEQTDYPRVPTLEKNLGGSPNLAPAKDYFDHFRGGLSIDSRKAS